MTRCGLMAVSIFPKRIFSKMSNYSFKSYWKLGSSLGICTLTAVAQGGCRTVNKADSYSPTYSLVKSVPWVELVNWVWISWTDTAQESDRSPQHWSHLCPLLAYQRNWTQECIFCDFRRHQECRFLSRLSQKADHLLSSINPYYKSMDSEETLNTAHVQCGC